MKRFLIERHIPGVGQLTEQQLKDASATSNAALRATRVGEPAEEPHRRCPETSVAPLNRVFRGHDRSRTKRCTVAIRSSKDSWSMAPGLPTWRTCGSPACACPSAR